MKNVIPEVDSKSMDIVADNISKLKELFPEVFTEGKVDFDALKEVLGGYIDGREERYSFTWNGKSKARMLAQTPSAGTLRPCKEESVDWDTTQNLFIEGDNLEVLKLLQKSYHKKVKMIYIDPPYNTGKDFVYKDNFKDNIKNYKEITGQVDGDGRSLSSNPETNGRYHTDWLNMMYPRLKLARNLLKDDGIIFISIDDNEYHNLKLMCDEVFGEERFVGSISWKNKYGAGAKTKGFIEVHEYILCYSKSELINISSKLSEDQRGTYNKKDEKYNTRGGYFTQPLMTTSMDDRKNLQYDIEYDGDIIKPKKQWVWAKERLLKAIEDNEVVIKKKVDGSYSVRYKVYLIDEQGNERKGKPLSLLNGPFNQEGTKEVEELLGPNIFSFPKPTSLIEFFFGFEINDESDKSGIYLDFFSGSCSSAQAVLHLNLQDNGSRRYIMVQLPELISESSEAYKSGYKTIAEISKERIRRAAAKIKQENPDYQGDLGFKALKLDSTNIKPWELDFDLTEQDLEDQISNIKHGREEEDVLYEVLLKYGLDLTLPITEHSVAGHKVFDIGMGALMICLSDDITLDVVEGIAKLKDELNPEIMRVVFKDAGFADDVVKTNAVQILKQAGIEDVRSL
ncbi:TPA: site-specific DNA-methyltransferase [Klebsiella pneumoniae]|uniref:site-specific DNA-methyltransferase (adenine-specific) n=3 Tax=Enterobacteriaceae TaxID=543 RepID=A0A5Y3XG25_SALER|nr:site-specific DNA-methyltransferase [Klebsiella pneumoniae]ECJ4508719.1 site-specific DNA-methyltransferase [Salmonella enterica subsp. salamae]HAV1621086.1 site-specific DNA-methyltransferase [Enterobacter hormaechei subsp. steigerwaltii]HED3305932.1 site-specific DNA-methyltransferase [Klebsiella quasipneumoniae subsp. similipneumoniae]EKZ9780819.1 site-specific DNA-methyltransferase [Klebsiella pneumoniae]KAB7934618.1 site-specific DNA-methyltransferase [Klebsiella pneumoniae]